MAGEPHHPYCFWKTLQCETEVSCVKFNNGGSLLAIGDHNGNLSIWDVDRGLRVNHDQPNEPLPIYDIVWSKDNFSIFIGQHLGRYTLWDVPRGRKVKAAYIREDYIASVDIDSRGSLGLVGGETDLSLIDIRTLNAISSKRAHHATNGFITASRFSTDGSAILSSGLNDNFQLWEKGSFSHLDLSYPQTPPVMRAVYFPGGNNILATYTNKTFQVLNSLDLDIIGNGAGLSGISYANAAVDAGCSLLIGGDHGYVNVVCRYGVYQRLLHNKLIEIIECCSTDPITACVPFDDNRVYLWKY